VINICMSFYQKRRCCPSIPHSAFPIPYPFYSHSIVAGGLELMS
jgi:hypothetical protein